MNIRFSQPKYIIPLILIPFNVFLFYMLKDSFATEQKAEKPQEELGEINTTIPLPNLEKRPLKSKFDSFRETYKYNRDFTAMKEIDRREQTEKTTNQRQTEIADSVHSAILDGAEKDFMTHAQVRTQAPSQLVRSTKKETLEESEYDIQMRLFKEQVHYLDSLAAIQEAQPETTPDAKSPTADKKEVVEVHNVEADKSGHFNTIQPEKTDDFIHAIIDEDIKVFPGSRVRLRLMQDIRAGDHQIAKGTYIFATITAFKAQRIELNLSSMLTDGKIIPVDMMVYDNDGLPGLYVPASRFREFTKDVAANSMGSQQLPFGRMPGNETEMLYNMADRAYNTTTRSISRAAKKNKAKLKYNTILYLVNSKDIN
jgi:conjugative transposon TraM protein